MKTILGVEKMIHTLSYKIRCIILDLIKQFMLIFPEFLYFVYLFIAIKLVVDSVEIICSHLERM